MKEKEEQVKQAMSKAHEMNRLIEYKQKAMSSNSLNKATHHQHHKNYDAKT